MQSETFSQLDPLIPSGYWQTIIGSFGLPLIDPPSTEFFVDVTEKDKLSCWESTPPSWKENDPIIVLVHGVAGSSRSRYMVRLARAFYRLGFKVVRLNLRGCGTGDHLARLPHNAGASDDLFAVISKIKVCYPKSPVRIAGFSIGGNLLLKMLGELSVRGSEFVDRAIAVCPAIDPSDCARRLEMPENRLFQSYYVKSLLEIAEKTEKYFPEMGRINPSKIKTIYQFDDCFTAPRIGFKTAADYYEDASGVRHVPFIAVPTWILYSEDDPVVGFNTIDAINAPPGVYKWKTRFGGHLGFLSRHLPHLRWMDEQVIKILNAK